MAQISRNGEILGEFEVARIPDEMAKGKIMPTDWIWTEGMTDWVQVDSYLQQASRQKPGVPKPTSSPRKAKKPRKDWHSDPATEKQLSFLSNLGVKVATPLTKGEASALIYKHRDSPEAIAFQNSPEGAARQMATWEKQYEEAYLQRNKFPSHYILKNSEKLKAEVDELTAEIEKAPREIKRLKAEVGKSKAEIEQLKADSSLSDEARIEKVEDKECELEDLEGEIELLEGDVQDKKDELKDWKEELKSEIALRAKFWKQTFRAEWIDNESADELMDYFDGANRYHEEFGQYLKVPTLTEIKEILAELDSGDYGWDSTAPEAFYARLTARNPDAFLKSKASTESRPVVKSKNVNCFPIILALIIIILGIVMLLTMR